jgi:hypothetical protein
MAGTIRLRTGVVALIVAFASILGSTPASATTNAEVDAATRAAGWIAREWAAPDSEIVAFGTGTLIDALIGIAVTGTEPATALEMLATLRADAAGYIGTGSTSDVGPLGKLLLVLGIYGYDPATFVTGRDIEAELRAAIAGDGQIGDAGPFIQALAILGLERTSGGAPDVTGAWLAATGCVDGSFTFDGTGCGGSEVDADSTAMAVQALLATGQDAAAAEAVSALRAAQDPSGGFVAFGAANANTTALASQALVVAGDTVDAGRASDFLRELQFPAAAAPEDAGGFRYVASDIAANTFATVAAPTGLGAPGLATLTAPELPTFGDVPTGSTFAVDIDWLADSGITKGCNPPLNTNFCPDTAVTRAQMAAFLVRALDIPSSTGNPFGDDDGTQFEGQIGAIAAAGITRGCNPPDNDRFCPDEPVTRAQMAAFLVRAFGLPAPLSADRFTDDDGSVFEADIQTVAAYGIARGCNPPANTAYCPDEQVTRAQMAALLHRASLVTL